MKITPLSGFPEWLPEGRIVEQRILDTLRETFELHGFSGIETRAVEPLDQLLRKGETSKEVYVLQRLQGGEAQDSDMGLHFDLTVPLARYVLENSGKLDFPFKRYQIQKVWRGERPQDGRFREFVQADVDVVGADSLAFHHDIELPLVMVDALSKLPCPRVVVRASNRKVAQGFYEAIGLDDVVETLRIVDKLDKVGPAAVTEMLAESVGASEEQARLALALAEITGADASVAEKVVALGHTSALLEEGLDELVQLIEGANELLPGSVVADLKIARGLDYYTGTVYETTLNEHPEIGSICSGGRYDNLAGNYTKSSLPGVGISIGLTRLFWQLREAGLLKASHSTVQVLVTQMDAAQLPVCLAIAKELRDAGIATEIALEGGKLGKQLKYADRAGIRFAVVAGEDELSRGAVAVKDLRRGDQFEVPRAELVKSLRVELAQDEAVQA